MASYRYSVITVLLLLLRVVLSILTCPFNTNALQIFEVDTCAICEDNFNALIKELKKYGDSRAVVMAAPLSSPGSGKSTYLSHIIKIHDAYVSRCRGAGHITNGVWMHRVPLTCCSISYLHGLDSSICDCRCYNDERDMAPASNTCPLILLPDVEGSGENTRCSFAPFYVLSQVHYVLANHLSTLGFNGVVGDALHLVANMEAALRGMDPMLGSSESGSIKQRAFGLMNHELHFVNIRNTAPSFITFLRNEALRNSVNKPVMDRIDDFYGPDRIKEWRTSKYMFDPANAPDLVLQNDDGTCKSDNEQEEGIKLLLSIYLSKNFSVEHRHYLESFLLRLKGLSLPVVTGSSRAVTVADFEKYLPLLVGGSNEDGCPHGSLSCGVYSIRCVRALSEKIAIVDEIKQKLKFKTLSLNTFEIEVMMNNIQYEFSTMLMRNKLLEPYCFNPNGNGRLLRDVEREVNLIAVETEAELRKSLANVFVTATAPRRQGTGNNIGIFGEDDAELVKPELMSDFLNSALKVVKHESHSILISGFELNLGSTNLLTLSAAVHHGKDIIISVHRLTVPSGKFVLNAPGRKIVITANNIDVHGSWTVDVSGTAKLCTFDHNGHQTASDDRSGANGDKGNSAGSISIRSRRYQMHKDGKVNLVANGGPGCPAQRGGKGGTGTKGARNNNPEPSCGYYEHKKGHKGHKGNPGGKGKPSGQPGLGGDGGEIKTDLPPGVIGGIAMDARPGVNGSPVQGKFN
jgi:hypothetical protein